MANYDKFYKHYDAVMGDPKQKAVFLTSLIKKWNPKATTLLELACGTGAILQHLVHNFEVSGLDLSAGMLSIARKRLPKTRFFKQDMTQFSIPQNFDVILCVYDSINHLVRFNDWQKVFARTKRHINENGIFIFDVNTHTETPVTGLAPADSHGMAPSFLLPPAQAQKAQAP